jgi:acyl-CoA synthetase (AMP-forming)/AMP-acid ligase II
MQNSPQYAALYYGTMAASGAAVPLNVHEKASTLARQIEYVGCKTIAVDVQHPEWPALRSSLRQCDIDVVTVTMTDDADSFDTFLPATAADAPFSYHEAPAHDVAMIIFTSGTTARPKAVMLSHGNLAANATAIAAYLQVATTDRVLCVLPFQFSYGNSVLNSNLIAGAHLLLEDNFAFPHVTLRRMQDERVTGFPGVPSTFAMLLGRCRLADYDLTSLRYITQAGGPMPRAHIEQLRMQLPHARTFIMYGQTEATSRISYLPPEKLGEKLGSVGMPLEGLEIQIRENQRRLGPGEVGEICARGASIMLGYWGDPELSAQTVRDGWLHTGDLGHVDDDGYLFIDGRAVDMIKVGAFRVSPQEVEEVLAGCADVQEVAVTGVPDPMLGQAIKAVVVARAGVELDAQTLKAHCRTRLANYKVPKIVEFANALPRTSSGKVQRYKLA